ADLARKVLGTLKTLVHRSESYVGHVVHQTQSLESNETNLFARHVTIEQTHGFINPQHQFSQSLFVDGAVLAGRANTTKNLGPIKEFAFTRTFDDVKAHFFDSFEGRIALTASRALSAPAYRHPVFGQARINDAVVICRTERTAHGIHDTPKSFKFQGIRTRSPATTTPESSSCTKSARALEGSPGFIIRA